MSIPFLTSSLSYLYLHDIMNMLKWCWQWKFGKDSNFAMHSWQHANMFVAIIFCLSELQLKMWMLHPVLDQMIPSIIVKHSLNTLVWQFEKKVPTIQVQDSKPDWLTNKAFPNKKHKHLIMSKTKSKSVCTSSQQGLPIVERMLIPKFLDGHAWLIQHDFISGVHQDCRWTSCSFCVFNHSW
jgi:hypothetical protein